MAYDFTRFVEKLKDKSSWGEIALAVHHEWLGVNNLLRTNPVVHDSEAFTYFDQLGRLQSFCATFTIDIDASQQEIFLYRSLVENAVARGIIGPEGLTVF